MKLRIPALTLVVCLFPFLCSAQVTIDNTKIRPAISKTGEWFVKDKRINSVSIGVFSNGEAFSAHYGALEKGQGNTPDDNTLYEIASVTKTMTGLLLARAVSEGKVSLEDSLNQYLPSPYPNLRAGGTTITLKHLATHTSGLPGFLPLALDDVFVGKDPQAPNKFVAIEKQYDKAQFLQDLAEVKLSSRPGAQYAYSNAGIELLGYVLEQVYQKSIDALLQETFLAETEMNNTSIALTSQQQKELVRGYWLDNDEPAPNFQHNLWATGSGVKSTTADLLKYIELQLRADDPIVAASHQVLYNNGKGTQLAYCWNVKQDRYGNRFDHHGGTGGVQNWLFIFPKYDLGISIITNQSDYSTPKRLSKATMMILKAIVPD
ncbi:MAG: serine hydrolase domain-containing protein [Bacteroidota bacterium]